MVKVVVVPMATSFGAAGVMLPPPPAEGVIVTAGWKVAVTPVSWEMVKVQSPVPLQADAEPLPPDQPVKIEPFPAPVERVICVPDAVVQDPVAPFQLRVQPVAST